MDSILTSTSAASESGDERGRDARVRIGYAVRLEYALDGAADFLFLIHPARTARQTVVDERLTLVPEVEHVVEADPASGNRVLKLRCTQPSLAVTLDATVDIRHCIVEPGEVVARAPAELPAAVLRYVLPSRYCQSDRLQADAWKRFGSQPRGYAQVEAVVSWVREGIRFRPGSSDPSTSCLETLGQREGVCRDFAHLAIAMCRALNYPARIVTGVDYGADPSLGPPDFHAYVEVYLDRWYLFDPTGISPTTGLVRIATGRDAADVSFATIFGAVRTGMPRVTFEAIEDRANGIRIPSRTSLAVSTADA